MSQMRDEQDAIRSDIAHRYVKLKVSPSGRAHSMKLTTIDIGDGCGI